MGGIQRRTEGVWGGLICQGWAYQFIEAGIAHSRPFCASGLIVKQGKTITAVNVAKDMAASGGVGCVEPWSETQCANTSS